MVELFCAALTGVFTVLVAVIETRNTRDRKQTESRAERRAEESRLSMELMSANCRLSLVTAKKVMGQKTNGDVEEAFEAVSTAQTNYDGYIRRLAAQSAVKV